MKNRDIKNIEDFKNRLKSLYEYKVHDLNMYKEENVYNMHEDDNQFEEPEQVTPEPSQPVSNEQLPQPEPQQPEQPQPEPVVQNVQEPVIPEPVQQEDPVLSYLKSELQKLENIVSTIDNISMSVNMTTQRLDKMNGVIDQLSKSVDEIKEPSDIEKLEMRAFDSYPYNNTLTKVWNDKMKSKEEQDMERNGVYKTNDGYEMEYTPNNNYKFNQPNLNF